MPDTSAMPICWEPSAPIFVPTTTENPRPLRATHSRTNQRSQPDRCFSYRCSLLRRHSARYGRAYRCLQNGGCRGNCTCRNRLQTGNQNPPHLLHLRADKPCHAADKRATGGHCRTQLRCTTDASDTHARAKPIPTST